MKFESEIFKCFNGEYDGGLSQTLWKLVHKTHAGADFQKFFDELTAEVKRSDEKSLLEKLLKLDHLIAAYRDTCLDFGLTAGFVLGKHFDLSNPSAVKEYDRVEAVLKKNLPFWSREPKP